MGKVAAGVGVAGLAFVSWKIVAAGALAYSAYKSGQYVYGRFYRRDVKKEAKGFAQAAEQEARPEAAPIQGGHDADGDRERREREPLFHDVIADLRRRQGEIRNRHGRIAFEAIITHPDVLQKGGNIQWLGKMIRQHGKWSKRTFGLSLYLTKAYRTVKCCKPKKPEEIRV